MNKMIAYCGLDCEKCDAYLATINDDHELRRKTAKLWAELNNAPILPEHINCQGVGLKELKLCFAIVCVAFANVHRRRVLPLAVTVQI